MKTINVNEKNIIITSIILGIIITFLITTKNYAYNTQQSIADEIIRLHILANSDSEEDQLLKMKVKEGVTKMLEKSLKDSKTKDETRIILLQNLNNIEKKAYEIIKENGYNYNVSAKISFEQFPTKQYANITLPSGEYEALKIELGDAKGKNWWCVMFPPLCFLDATTNTISKEDDKKLKNILTTDEYDIVTNLDSKKIPIKIKFKIIELWQR